MQGCLGMTTADVGDGGTMEVPVIPADPGGFIVPDIFLNTPSCASARENHFTLHFLDATAAWKNYTVSL
jgi:hypothetical protein